jgi:hypothetical protein
MKNILNLMLVILIVGNISTNLYGSIVTGKYAGEFMAIGVGARPLGMGGAFVAIANDVTAAYWNPAGLLHLNYPQLSGMYAQQFANIVNYNYGGVAAPMDKKSTLAVSFIRLGVDDIPYTEIPRHDLETGATYNEDGTIKRNIPFILRTFTDAEWAIYLSYAKLVNENFSWGSNIKIVTKQVGDNSAWGLGFDLGFMYRLYPRFVLGVNFQDITTTLLAWDTGRREAITPTLKTGVAYFYDFPLLAGKIIPALDFDIRFENRRFASQFNIGPVSFDSHLGVEYEFKNILALRGGITDVGKFTVGTGIKLPKLNIDYAFLNHELGETHRISLTLSLEEKKFLRKK